MPELIDGFFVITYDNEVDSRVIEQSSLTGIVLDARSFVPAIIPIQNFIVDPTNVVVSTFSTWTIQLTVNIPMEIGCYIDLILPPDFIYAPHKVTASGIFMPTATQENIPPSELNVTYRDGVSIKKSSIFFKGCQSVSGLGVQPFGSLQVSNVSTPNSLKDSETFEIRIYKDQAKTKLIAKLGEGKFLPAANLRPGELRNVKLEVTNPQVQTTTSYKFTFTVDSQLEGDSAVTIRFPAGVTLPSEGTVVTVASPDGSTPAREGKVLPGNNIQIKGLSNTGVKIPVGTTIKVEVFQITNQISARDAGDFMITTQNYINGEYYTVGQLTQ